MRRRVVLIALVLVLSACASWSQYRGNAAHTGYQPLEGSIGVSNVSDLAAAWSVPNVDSSGVVAGRVLYAPSPGGLEALDAAGVNGCSGSPRVCSPLWTGSVPPGTSYVGTPAVANGVVYAIAGSAIAGSTTLLAFDAAGVNGCGGIPKTCTPLWSARATGSQFFLSPTVANGAVYIGSDTGTLHVYDAAGVNGCSGVPRTCQPLWTGVAPNGGPGSPSVANGIVYLGGNHQIEAFDAGGVVGCSGVPKTCAPLWTAPGPDRLWTLAVANGVVYAGGFGSTAPGELDAYDAAGTQGCSGLPKTCTALWTATVDSLLGNATVAGGAVYAGTIDGELLAFDAKGISGCSGLPKTCTPLWTAETGGVAGWSVSVANGVVYMPTGNQVFAFDAVETACPGTPGVCDPLWASPSFPASAVDPFVVNGTVYAFTQDGAIHALRLTAP